MRRLLCLLILLTSGCGKSSDSGGAYDTSTASVASSATSGAAASSDDSAGSPVASYNVHLLSLLLPQAHAAACTSASKIRGLTCSGAIMSLPLASCSAGGGAWTGAYTLTFNTAGACTAASSGGMMSIGAGNSATITAPGAGVTRAVASGAYVTTSSDASGFSSTVNGGLQTTCVSSDCSSGGGRTVNILGMHRTEYGASGKLGFDHSLNTSTPFTITGTGANRVISAGTLVLQHNLAKFIASSTVTQPLTFSAGCCFPTGGTMTTTFSGGKTGTETVVYTSTCGAATVNGNAVTLTHCQ